MEINVDILKANGYKEEYDDILNRNEYTKIIDVEFKRFYICIKHISNMVGRDWSIHIDNGCCDTIAHVDIHTIEQLNKVYELIGINEIVNNETN